MAEQAQIVIHIPVYRKLLSDWFVKTAADRNIAFSNRAYSKDYLQLGQPTMPCVYARYVDTPPFLHFEAIDVVQQDVVDEIAREAIQNIETKGFGSQVWYTAILT